jgi:hypothetical protein
MEFAVVLGDLQALPLPFWLTVVILVVGAWWAMGELPSGLGLPALAVLGTVTVWYVGDALYNDYASYHVQMFEASDLSAAWWQVASFLVALLILIRPVHERVNRRYLGLPSWVHRIMMSGQPPATSETRLRQVLIDCVFVFSVLAVIAAVRLGAETPYYFMPLLGHRADPWGREQIGGGISALLSAAQYLQLFIGAMFGVIAALARKPWVRIVALVGCGLTWPYFVLGRARNVMIAVVLPGILSWVFLRLRWSMLARACLLGVFFLAFSAWFTFVINNRDRAESSIVDALRGESGQGVAEAESRHLGLNMYEELCWINSFVRDGSYRPNWGDRYLEEVVNPIPRGLWSGKPLIGLDYAVARGQQYTDTGTTATVSTGMIGQGVVNFGRYLGPPFAAFLMSLWVALLARLDLQGLKIGRLPLYVIGLVLTFNLGRDITFLTLYTFAFGWLVVWWWGRNEAVPLQRTLRNASAARRRHRRQPWRQVAS